MQEDAVKPPEDPECGCDTHLTGQHNHKGKVNKGEITSGSSSTAAKKKRDAERARKLEEQQENLSILKK